MTNVQEIQVERSKLRERVNSLLGIETDKRSESESNELADLTGKLQALEPELRAALTAETTDERLKLVDGEGSELRSLASRVNPGEYLRETLTATPLPAGSAEVELRSAVMGENARANVIPWIALDPGRGGSEVEARADAISTVAATVKTAGSQSTILGRIFAQTAAAFVGCEFPSVPAGTAAHPVLSSGPSGSRAVKGATVDAEATTFVSAALSPGRGTARVIYNIEDAARLSGMGDSVREDLRGVAGELVDAQVIAGNGTAPNINGFYSALTATPATNPNAVSDWDDLVKLVSSNVDGRYALTAGDVRLLMGADSYAFASVTKAATGPNETALDFVSQRAGGHQVSAHVPEAASDVSRVLAYRAANPGAAVCPIWEGVSMALIEDPFSGAAAGRVALTLHVLFSFAIRRADSYSLQKIKIA